MFPGGAGCQLGLYITGEGEGEGAHLVDRLPRLLSSKMHSWFPVWQRLHGGPCSAPTHFIFNRRQTVQALHMAMVSHGGEHRHERKTYRAPRVGFAFGSSPFSAKLIFAPTRAISAVG